MARKLRYPVSRELESYFSTHPKLTRAMIASSLTFMYRSTPHHKRYDILDYAHSNGFLLATGFKFIDMYQG